MPEFPEVETTRRGIAPFLVGQLIQSITIHEHRLRWPVPNEIQQLESSAIIELTRRGKYLLIHNAAGAAIVHLGMSGSLRIAKATEPRKRHDHIELVNAAGQVLRYHDPRRFGCWLWQPLDAPTHPLLASLGPEPLQSVFDGEYLFTATRKRAVAIKNFIMNSKIVVGVGNIYASESLFIAGIRPGRAARRLTRQEAHRLADAIKSVLQKSIDQGGTTLRDFVNSNGEPGYFKQMLFVYDRAGTPCRQCKTLIKQRVMGQRSTFYCPACQL